jgi:hypothetical protein
MTYTSKLSVTVVVFIYGLLYFRYGALTRIRRSESNKKDQKDRHLRSIAEATLCDQTRSKATLEKLHWHVTIYIYIEFCTKI